jgi:alpha-tubulin suppressor-like RCC1 family protein
VRPAGGELGCISRSGNHEVTPARVTGLAGVTKISAGDDFALALCSDGTVSAWGDNRRGQLGDGTTTDPAGPVQVTGLADATQVAAGDRFSLAIHTVPGLVGS